MWEGCGAEQWVLMKRWQIVLNENFLSCKTLLYPRPKIVQMFNAIKPHLSLAEFSLPNTQSSTDYFPKFLEDILNKFNSYYRSKLASLVNSNVKFDAAAPLHNHVGTKIQDISGALVNTVVLYYEGKVLEATNCFNSAMDSISFSGIKLSVELSQNTTFYRARCNEGRAFAKRELFHLPFEKRHFVSTNRYSIPGFPALYLGSSTYVCWEEFNRHRLRDLWFSRFVNDKSIKVVQIQRIEDFLSAVEKLNPDWQTTYLLRYLVTFPIALACTIRVKENGVFKPEYIIPQMLLQYVSKSPEFDGIQFPSSKVDYSKLHGDSAYNFVFPVKYVAKSGYCSKLVETFHLSEPTSLEIEEILYNPKHNSGTWMDGVLTNYDKIELVSGESVHYQHTSFGRIEQSLRAKKLTTAI
jgi:hypothetical protein